ncbi:hypothetical protein Tco_1451311, partial [Tanacetum coccineum]
NWKPWHKDWDAITSNYSEDNVIKDDDNDDDNTINNDDKYRYNRKGFLEDDERSDDSIFIVDPGWDDYSLQTIKSNHPLEGPFLSFLIEESKFKIPLIYAFDMRDSNGIEMLIGANFLRSMKGGIRIEGDEITIYKKVTKIKTSNQTEIAEIAELEVSEEEFLEINESIYFNQEGSRAFQE